MTDLLRQFRIKGGFWEHYQQLICEVVIPYQEKTLGDQVEGAAKSHAIENFRIAAQLLETGHCDAPFYGMVFQDSDVAKWLEAAAYSLCLSPNPDLEERCDQVIALVGRAQNADGYLNTYFTVKAPQKRWTNLQDAHELYCAGHMIEAAVAYARCTGKTALLDIACAMAEHIYRRFITEGAEGYPGHPEIEMALIRLYRQTNQEKYLALAKHFVEVRGVDRDFFLRERNQHPWTVFGLNPADGKYLQCHAPVREQTDATGHAVRAVYLYTAMADLALQTGDTTLQEACENLWQSITRRRMYVTGGIGSAYEGEQFTKDYHLPSDTAYSETCASIGLIFFAKKMLDMEKRGEYADIMERALHNCVLAGMEMDGTRFFYVNPLEVIPGISGEAPPLKHDLPQRPQWFECACCPPNVARLIASIAQYAWSIEGNTLYSHLFISGALDVTREVGGTIHVETDYPHKGDVTYRFSPIGATMAITLALRLPGWCKAARITLNGQPAGYQEKDGYAYVVGSFSAADTLRLSLDMTPRRVYPSPKISALSGRVAFARGPLIYCAEGMDQQHDVIGLRALKNASIETGPANEQHGFVPLWMEGIALQPTDALYSCQEPAALPVKITLVPYYTWGNRGLTQMRVWLPEDR